MTQMTDPFEFLKSLWGSMGVPVPGVVAPTLNVNEIDKRIADLKSVENWLNLNLNVLKMTIQGLELQRSTLSAMQSGIEGATRIMQGAMPPGTGPGASAGSAGGAPAGSPGDAWWTVLQQAQEAAERLKNSTPFGAASGGGKPGEK